MRRFFWWLAVVIMVTTPVAANAQLPLLEGTSWQMAGEQEKGGRFISFAGEGRFSGFAGCNRIMGHYEIRNGLLTITSIGATRMACAPEVMTKEAAFLDMLGKVRGARVEDTVLRLLDEAGSELGTLEQRSP
jgi:putative lipoprotein